MNKLFIILIVIVSSCSWFSSDDGMSTERYYRIYGDCLGDSIDTQIRDDILALGWEIAIPFDSTSYPRITYRKYYTNSIGKEVVMNWRLQWVHHRWLEVNVAWSEAQYESVNNGIDTKFDSLYWEIRTVLESYCLLKDSLIIRRYHLSSPL